MAKFSVIFLAFVYWVFDLRISNWVRYQVFMCRKCVVERLSITPISHVLIICLSMRFISSICENFSCNLIENPWFLLRTETSKKCRCKVDTVAFDSHRWICKAHKYIVSIRIRLCVRERMYVRQMVSQVNDYPIGLLLFFSRATLKLCQSSEKNQFRFYMVYGWGLSAILTLTLPLLDYIEPFPSYLLPELDINTCFLRSLYQST